MHTTASALFRNSLGRYFANDECQCRRPHPPLCSSFSFVVGLVFETTIDDAGLICQCDFSDYVF